MPIDQTKLMEIWYTMRGIAVEFRLAMTLTLQHREELLHHAHVCAIASEAGVNLAFSREKFDYGIDGHFAIIHSDVDGKLSQGGAKVEFQLKASFSRVSVKKDYVSYKMEVDAYNKLVNRACDGVPVMLILLVLPKEKGEWLSLSENEMTLRKCCYWQIFTDTTLSSNSDSISVRFPIDQVLTPEKIVDVLEKIQQVNLQKLEEYRKFFALSGGAK